MTGSIDASQPEKSRREEAPLDLDTLERLADAATEGPWKVWAMEVLADPVGDSNLDTALHIADTADPHHGLRTFNAVFIAAARTAVPALVGEVRRLGEVLRQRDEEIRRLIGSTRNGDMPQYLAAVSRMHVAEAGLAELRAKVEEQHYEDSGQCVTCRDENDRPADWPCATAAIFAPTSSGGHTP